MLPVPENLFNSLGLKSSQQKFLQIHFLSPFLFLVLLESLLCVDWHTLYCSILKVKWLSHVRLFVTPWTIAYQVPPSMEFSGKSTGVGCHFLLQRIFLTQGSNPGLPHCRQMFYHLSTREASLYILIVYELNIIFKILADFTFLFSKNFNK